MGIILDSDPKVIIEDIKSKESFIISKGEEIGGAILSEVYEDKAIFLSGNETVELAP